MALPQPQKVRATTFGDYIRVRWEGVVDPDVHGYKIYTGDNPTPNWTTAIDNGLNDGDDGTEVKTYVVLIHMPTKTVCRWETFETYSVGKVNEMKDNLGLIWDGPAVVGENYIRTVAREDFESYAEGTVPDDTGELDGGLGWDGAAVIGSFS